MVDCLLSMHRALGWISSTRNEVRLEGAIIEKYWTPTTHTHTRIHIYCKSPPLLGHFSFCLPLHLPDPLIFPLYCLNYPKQKKNSVSSALEHQRKCPSVIFRPLPVTVPGDSGWGVGFLCLSKGLCPLPCKVCSRGAVTKGPSEMRYLSWLCWQHSHRLVRL